MSEQRPAYDEKQRDRIRRALQQYKDHHGVGAPTLQRRIAEAIGDENPDRIPIKSLQRFLAGTHRTDDAVVDHCERFLQSVAPPPPEEQLLESLIEFWAGAADVDYDYDPFCDVYYAFAKTGHPAGGTVSWTPYSVLTLESSGRTRYLEASERIINPDRSPDLQKFGVEIFRAEPLHDELRYSGILVHYEGASNILLMRNYFHTRFSLLTKGSKYGNPEAIDFFGAAIEPLYPIAPHYDGKTGFDMKLISAAKCEGHPSNPDYTN